MSGEADKKPVDWEIVEKDYRAGLMSLRQLADEHGVSHVTIAKRAKKYGWEKNLEEKIQTTAKNKIARTVVNRQGNSEVNSKDQLSDAQVVNAYADVVASVDLIQREDVKLAVDASRGHLSELVALTDPAYKDKLQWVVTLMERANRVKAEKGKKKPMPSQEDLDELLDNFHDLADVYALFKYTTTLHSRVKLAKEIAASHGVYIPLQRKIFGLDSEKKSTGEFEEMLRQVQAEE